MSELIETIKSLTDNYVTIGIQGEKGEQKKLVRISDKEHRNLKSISKGRVEKHRINPDLTVAEVAEWMEFGTEKIPARSFIQSTLIKDRNKILKAASLILIKEPKNFYDRLGQVVLNLVRKNIKNGIDPPNSPHTIARKKSSKPLIDTGQLFDSLTYKVSSHDKP